jgi:hypothetical protein
MRFPGAVERYVVGFSEADSKLIHGHGLYTISVGRVHQTLRVTPAMESGLTDHIWSLEELVGLLDARKTEAAA